MSSATATVPVAAGRVPVVVETPGDAVPAVRRPVPILASLVWASIVAGFAVRTFVYLRNPSLWLDEAMLALNVAFRSPSQLLEPLDLNQGAPVGFLMLAKACTAAFGSGELALRFVPFVAGMLGFAMFVPLAYRALPLAAARFAIVLFAISPFLAGYGAEFKQYESDAAIAVGLMLLGVTTWQGTASRGRFVALAAAGAASVWCSHPATFVLGGVGTAILADAAIRRDRAALLSRMLVVGVWVGSFAACYWFFLRKLGMNDYLMRYWAGKFMALPPKSPGDLAWIVHHFFEFFEKPGGMAATAMAGSGLAGLLYLLGAMKLARTDWRLLVALTVPMMLALLASGLKKYPFAGRLMLFAVPAALLLIAYGTSVVAAAVNRSVPGGGWLLYAAVLLAPAMETNWLLKQPIHSEDARGALEYVHAHWQPGDRAYVFYGAAAAYAYYSPQFPLPMDAVTFGVENRGKEMKQFLRELEPYRGSPRVWVIVAHRQHAEDAALRAYLDALGECRETVPLAEASVYLYDLSR